MTDRIVIIGGGIAGLATALRLAPLPVTLLAGAPLATGAATAWAQGGIAAAMAADDDPALHAADTLKAAAGIGDPAVAEAVAKAAPAAIRWLDGLGAPFDRDEAGRLALGLEAAHCRRRIVHAQGDATGRAVLETLIRAVRAEPAIELREDTSAGDLVQDRDGAVAGVMAMRGDTREFVPARALVMATGGIGGLYRHTTNPLSALGSGLAMAARAGAVLSDLEFVQFHPTAIDCGSDPMPLATEALRGEGAILVNGRGERFMADIPGAELAPRDVVARAIWRELERRERVFLDGRQAIGTRFPARFPSVTALCRALGLDPVTMPIPVRPAAHYHMGGIKVDPRGRSGIPGLWACGEVAATGLHGANRLASNSLLEALAFARVIAGDIADGDASRRTQPVELPAPTAAARDPRHLARLRTIMEERLGVIRDAEGMEAAMVEFAGRAAGDEAALVGLLIGAAASSRRESRGGHFRADFPAPQPAFARPSDITLDEALALGRELGAAPARHRRS
ncbi:MAG: L-aspartate oxidase [Stellaceae bacterium]